MKLDEPLPGTGDAMVCRACAFTSAPTIDARCPACGSIKLQPLPVITGRQRLVLVDVLDERARQDAQWGGAAHDDQHSAGDWLEFIADQKNLAFSDRDDVRLRERYVKIAALAVAALESLDRKATVPP